MSNKLSHGELSKQIHTGGWQLTDKHSDKTMTGTLSDVLTESHSRRSKGEQPGKIKQIETTIELEMFQIEQLWQHLGLPTI
jgi:hypothetical protein